MLRQIEQGKNREELLLRVYEIVEDGKQNEIVQRMNY